MKSKMTHSQKLKMARRMMSKQEIKNHISPFMSKAWNERKDNKQIRIENQKVRMEYKHAVSPMSKSQS